MKKGKCWLNFSNAMEEVMNGRVAEAIELKERYGFLQNAIKAESALKKHMESCYEESRENLIMELNKLLYETANKQGISLYQLCSLVEPEFSYDIKHTKNEQSERFDYVTTITLKQIIR